LIARKLLLRVDAHEDIKIGSETGRKGVARRVVIETVNAVVAWMMVWTT
jgi:hypothetical protein